MSLQRKLNNPFAGYSFYINGQNSLVLDEKQTKKIFYKDVLVKLGENKIKKFDDFPLSAQKALLDLAYNKGHLPKQVIALAEKEDWGARR